MIVITSCSDIDGVGPGKAENDARTRNTPSWLLSAHPILHLQPPGLAQPVGFSKTLRLPDVRLLSYPHGRYRPRHLLQRVPMFGHHIGMRHRLAGVAPHPLAP